MKVRPGFYNRIATFQESHDMTRSGALRYLIRAGLDADENNNTNPHAVTIPILMMWFGSIVAAAQYATASGAIGPIGIAAIAVGFALTRQSISRQIRNLTDR